MPKRKPKPMQSAMEKRPATRCETCRHWHRDDEPDWKAEKIGFRKCMAIRERWRIEDDATRWAPEAVPEAEWEARKLEALTASKAYVQDGSEYVAELFTGPGFGCPLHEAKE